MRRKGAAPSPVRQSLVELLQRVADRAADARRFVLLRRFVVEGLVADESDLAKLIGRIRAAGFDGEGFVVERLGADDDGPRLLPSERGRQTDLTADPLVADERGGFPCADPRGEIDACGSDDVVAELFELVSAGCVWHRGTP